MKTGIYLGISATDIQQITLTLFKDGKQEKQETKSGFADTYLQTIATLLAEWQIHAGKLAGLIVHPGPGAFTATRVSLAIANTLGFVYGLPLFTFEQKNDSNEFVRPIYDRSANIT